MSDAVMIMVPAAGSARFAPCGCDAPDVWSGETVFQHAVACEKFRNGHPAYADARELAPYLGAAFQPLQWIADIAAVAPIPMVLHCPRCGVQHVDAPEPASGWTNPPHRSHLCAWCGAVWRPADVATVGVERIETQGSADTWKLGDPPGDPLVVADMDVLLQRILPCTCTRRPACEDLPLGSRCAACRARVSVEGAFRLKDLELRRLVAEQKEL